MTGEKTPSTKGRGDKRLAVEAGGSFGGGKESDDGSEKDTARGKQSDEESLMGEGENGGIDSETEGAAVTLEACPHAHGFYGNLTDSVSLHSISSQQHLAFGRRKDEPSRPIHSPTPSAEQRPTSSHDRRTSISFVNLPFGASSSSTSANDQHPLHTTQQHPPSSSSSSQRSFNLNLLNPAHTAPASSQARLTSSNLLHLQQSPSNRPSDPSPPPPSQPPLPARSTPFSLLNVQSKAAMGTQARGPASLNFGGPLGTVSTMPPLGKFGRPPGSEEKVAAEEEEGRRRMKKRDLTEPKAVFEAFFQRSE